MFLLFTLENTSIRYMRQFSPRLLNILDIAYCLSTISPRIWSLSGGPLSTSSSIQLEHLVLRRAQILLSGTPRISYVALERVLNRSRSRPNWRTPLSSRSKTGTRHNREHTERVWGSAGDECFSIEAFGATLSMACGFHRDDLEWFKPRSDSLEWASVPTRLISRLRCNGRESS